VGGKVSQVVYLDEVEVVRHAVSNLPTDQTFASSLDQPAKAD